MATQAPVVQKPLFYDQLEPLSSQIHGNYKVRQRDSAPFLAATHAVPLTCDEFIAAQRDFPIVFSSGDQPVPLALMGLNDGVNVFVDEQGRPHSPVYMPAYVRRYPFLLARLRPDSQELSLCFDPSSEVVGAYDEGEALFDGDKPSETLNSILKFCEEFEIAAQRTTAFITDLKEMDLLMDGEVAVQPQGFDQPFVYRGFQMVDEQKLRALDTEKLKKIHDNGMLTLIMAHQFSLPMIRDIFGRQMQQGKVPTPQQATQPAPAQA